MPIVNYVREHERFIEYAANKGLTANEQVLWYALFHIFNAQAEGNVWPGDFIEIPNKRLFAFCPMGFDAMARARNKLKQIGLIDFRNGNRNKDCPTYRMNWFDAEDCPQKTDNAGFYPQKTDKATDKTEDKTQYKTESKTGDKLGYPYINQNKGYTEPYQDFDEEDDNDKQLSARARAEADAAWTENFGQRATPAMLARIGHAEAVFWRFDSGVIAYAVELAAMSGGGNPVGYLFKTLDDWYRNRVFTRGDAEEYVYLYRAVRGANEFLGAGEAADRIRDFRQDRESDEERKMRETWEAEEEDKRREYWARKAENEAAREAKRAAREA